MCLCVPLLQIPPWLDDYYQRGRQKECHQLAASHRSYTVKASSTSTLRFVTYHCPGWRAKLNGLEHPIDVEAQTGLQLIDVPAGSHRLELSYEVPWSW